MARLNDVGLPSADSIEAVKRRYLRQNLGLAKCNSMQSQRIRILESEVSRLLTMNAEVSEQNIALRVELERRPSLDGVQSIKQRLEDQMQQLGGLVAELSAMQQRPASDRRPKSAIKPERTDLDKMEDEARHMSTIDEEHMWPTQGNRQKRRTSTESRVTFDLSPSAVLGSPGDYDNDAAPPQISDFLMDTTVEEPTPVPSELSMNLETRRKRRDSDRRTTISADPSEAATVIDTDDELQFRSRAKFGLKRKLDVRDDGAESRGTPLETSRSDRQNTTSNAKSTIRDKRDAQQNLKAKLNQPRRPFGEKPVNTDPVLSPKKAKRSLLPEKPQKPPQIAFVRSTSLETKPSEMKTADSDDGNALTQKILGYTDPKTPASCDMFSPQSQVSTDRPVAKDTPPPANLAFGPVASGIEPVGRVARRARAVVNYAEPSLTSKMRRPTKELVDAVGKDGRPIAGSIVRKEADKAAEPWQPKSGQIQGHGTSIVQEEAPSPLVNRVAPISGVEVEVIDVLQTAKAATHRSSFAADTRAKQRPISSTNTGAEFTHDNLDKRRRKIDDIKDAEMSVYEFKDSSPLSQSSEEYQPKKLSSHRRHSSMIDVRSKRENGKLGQPTKPSGEDVLARSSRSIARRRSMMI